MSHSASVEASPLTSDTTLAPVRATIVISSAIISSTAITETIPFLIWVFFEIKLVGRWSAAATKNANKNGATVQNAYFMNR